jgi:kinesin family protein 5
MKFDAMNRMDSRQLSDAVSDKEKASRKSLQQRLEQLVAVHRFNMNIPQFFSLYYYTKLIRQLLRKFASLELEASELKKKTQLRDEVNFKTL